MKKNIQLGWVGLGLMGEPMCQHLLTAGYPMLVFTRSKEKARGLLSSGATWATTLEDVANRCEVVFTMVGSEQEIREVYFSDKGLFTSDISGKIFIDMGTTAPSLTQEIMTFAQERGAHTIDAPVSGGDIGAKNASLSIMAGGDKNILNQVSELFSCLGSMRVMGKAGSGQHTKMCNQIVVAGTMIGVCESLLYAKKAGIDCETLVAAISQGAAGCWSLDNLAPRINKQDFTPGFMVDHFIKDLGIALNEAQAMNINLPGLALAEKLYKKVHKMGLGKNGTQALLLALETD